MNGAPEPGQADSVLPVRLLILDVIGSILLAIGLIFIIADPSEFLPWDADYDELGMGLVIVGVLFMVPLISHVIGMARSRASGGPGAATPPGT